MNDIVTYDEHGELIEGATTTESMAVQLYEAETMQRVKTARQFPRSLKLVQNRILSMATLDEESANESIYTLARKGKPIVGPSIRFAEILSQSFGNCEAAARVVHTDRTEMYVEAEGVFIDWETNVKTTHRVRRRISDSKGRLYSDDMIIVTGNAAKAIALRNAILAGVPKPLWRKAYDAVHQTIAGDQTTLVDRRQRAVKLLSAFGLSVQQICAAIGRPSLEDITVDDMVILQGIHSGLKNGETTVEEVLGTGAPVAQGSMADRYKPKEVETKESAGTPPPADTGGEERAKEASPPTFTEEQTALLDRYAAALDQVFKSSAGDPSSDRLKMLKKASDVFRFEAFKEMPAAVVEAADKVFLDVQDAVLDA